MEESDRTKLDDPQFINELFYQYFTELDFKRLGNILNHLLDYLGELDIPSSDIMKAFDLKIQERLYEQDKEGAINYYLKSFKVESISKTRRLLFVRLLSEFLYENKEGMVKKDWLDIIKILTYQKRFSEMQDKDSELLGEIELSIGKMSGYYSVAPDQEEGAMREYINEFQTNFFKYLPDEEATDYAAQIILNSKPSSPKPY